MDKWTYPRRTCFRSCECPTILMLGAWQDLRQVTAGSRARGERLWEPARRGVGSCATSHTRGGFPARSHSLPSAPSTSTSGLGLAMPGRGWGCGGCGAGQPRAPLRRRELSASQTSRPHPLLFPIQPPRETELSCVCLLCRPRFAAAISPRLSPSPPLSLTAYFAAAPRAPPPFSAESPWRLG